MWGAERYARYLNWSKAAATDETVIGRIQGLFATLEDTYRRAPEGRQGSAEKSRLDDGLIAGRGRMSPLQAKPLPTANEGDKFSLFVVAKVARAPPGAVATLHTGTPKVVNES